MMKQQDFGDIWHTTSTVALAFSFIFSHTTHASKGGAKPNKSKCDIVVKEKKLHTSTTTFEIVQKKESCS